MFKELTFTNKVLTTEEIESANYIAQIVILHEDANSTFVNDQNTGVFKIFFESIIKVYGNNKKNIVNEVSSNSEWKKNIYVKCKLQDGALKASQKSLEELIELIHSKVYESVYKITRY